MDKISMRAARINAELTQAQAAKCVGVSIKTLQMWERYETSPNAKYIDKICEAYGRSYDGIAFIPEQLTHKRDRISNSNS